MSSSFEDATAGPRNTAADDALFRLLRAIADEIALLAGEIARIGEALTAERISVDESTSRHLQMFDVIAQSAQAQAQLMTRLLATRQTFPAATDRQLKAHIETVPFHETRRRLITAVDGASDSACDTGAAADLWPANGQSAHR